MEPANPSCEACHTYHEKRKKETPCGPCTKPVLWIENEIAWQLFEATTSQVRVAGMGGVLGFDYAALPFLFEVYGIPESERLILLNKLNAIYQVALKFWNKKDDKSPPKKP